MPWLCLCLLAMACIFTLFPPISAWSWAWMQIRLNLGRGSLRVVSRAAFVSFSHFWYVGRHSSTHHRHRDHRHVSSISRAMPYTTVSTTLHYVYVYSLQVAPAQPQPQAQPRLSLSLRQSHLRLAIAIGIAIALALPLALHWIWEKTDQQPACH